MSTITQLTLYNDALLECGERFLSSLTENREPRRLLDQVWASNGVKYILERGQWNFATRSQQIDYDSSINPGFGYTRAFDQPSDYCCTRAVCSDEYFREPLIRHVDEGGYWYSDLDTIYVRYVSDDPAYGMNLNKWPETFREVVAVHFASKIILKLSNSETELVRLEKKRDHMLKVAKNSSAQKEPTQFPPMGAWTRSRNRFPNRRDGGNFGGGPLIG
jgi:hypothetical protein